MIKFDDLYLKVITEKYYTYRMPEDKSLSMYDFYVLDYLNYILDQPSKNFRDLPTDLEDSVRDAIQSLYPALREELLNAVFYAICAEIRHAESYGGQNRQLAQDKPKYVKLYTNWLKYQNFHKKSMEGREELVNLYGIEKPSAKKRTPESEKGNDERRNLSYKAANYAIEQTGLSMADFVEMCEYLYRNGKWNSSYGGNAWANICEGWLTLHNANKINTSVKDKSFDDKSSKSSSQDKPMGVAIDHIYDLQHNTDTVFNKLKSYYKSGYGWIKKALDDKANVQNYHQLLNKCSGSVKVMALPILYNKLGTTWEKEMKIEKPKQSITNSPNDNTQFKVGDLFRGSPFKEAENNTYKILSLDSYTIVFKSTKDPIQKASMNLDNFNEAIKNGSIKFIKPSRLKHGDLFSDGSGQVWKVLLHPTNKDVTTIVNTKDISDIHHQIPVKDIENAIASGVSKLISPNNSNKVVTNNNTSYEVGDVIYVYNNNGDLVNYHWTITSISNDLIRLQLSTTGEIITTTIPRLIFGINNGTYSLNDVQKQHSPISKGDNVICINNRMLPFGTKLTKGTIYNIIAISTTSIGGAEMVQIIDDTGKKVMLRSDRFKKDSTPEFKIGDNVEIAISGLTLSPAVVTNYDEESGNYYITYKSKTSGTDINIWVNPSSIKLDDKI